MTYLYTPCNLVDEFGVPNHADFGGMPNALMIDYDLAFFPADGIV